MTNYQGAYKNNGCFAKPPCPHRQLTIVPICRNNYSNVLNEAHVYCRLQKKVIHTPHEHCALREELSAPLEDWIK